MKENKVIVLTGASKGIGEATAYQLAKKENTLILGARNQEKLQSVANKCKELGAKEVYFNYLDLTNADSIDSFFSYCQEKSSKIDVLINNAGIGYMAPFIETDPAIERKMIEVNTIGTMYLTHLAALAMLDHKDGKIISVASLAGKVPSPNMAVYGASKAAMISFQSSLRVELKPFNIQVTTINPGPVKTSFFDDFDPERNYLHNMRWFAVTPEQVAKEIVNATEHKRREVNIPWNLGFGARMSALLPHVTDLLYDSLIYLRKAER